MDLGLNGRNAVVCASSQGLGRACALELARAGCTVVVNGRDAETLERTAAEIRQESGGTVIAVAADVATPEGQEALLAAVPTVDILVNNNGGPPRRDFREIDREALLAGVVGNMVDTDRTGPAGDRRHGRAAVRPDRQHHLGFGQDAARRARPVERRPCRADRLPGRRRPVGRPCQRDDQLPAARLVRHPPAPVGAGGGGKTARRPG